MHAHLRLAATTAEPVRSDVQEPLLPADRTLFALVEPGDGAASPDAPREIEITDEMVREALEALDCEAVTPYRDGARPVARVTGAGRRSAEIIPFPTVRR